MAKGVRWNCTSKQIPLTLLTFMLLMQIHVVARNTCSKTDVYSFGYNREQKDSNVLNQWYFYSCMKQISKNFLVSF